MHIFKFDNRRELFFCTVRQESRGQRDRNPIFNLEGVSNKKKIKIGLWGAIGGAILTIIIGFSLGGWVLGSTSQKKADTMVADALVARLAPMCVAQFNENAEKDKKLKELKAKNRWERDKYVEEQGWATMPFEKEPDSKVAEVCVEQIMQIGQ